MVDNLLSSQIFKLKGRLFTITVIQLLQANIELFEQQMRETILQAPKLLTHMPVVLDCSALTTALATLRPFVSLLQTLKIDLVGVQGTQTWLVNLAQQEHVAIFQASSAQDKTLVKEVMTDTVLVTQPVRSGQQIVSKGGDLIVITSVGHGAELLSDGHIHVYGPLRGRALAGIKGNKQARIFCTQLDAELVSIAGHYRLRESIPVMNGPCQIFIHDDRLQIAAV